MTKKNDLVDSFNEYVKIEKMDGENKILNDKTNKKKQQKSK